MGAPTRIRRLRRSDAGSLLLETMVAIVIVTIVLFGVTAALITGVQSSAQQRSAQAAVQLATSALDQIQAMGAQGPDSLPDRTINGTTFRTTYTYTPCTVTATPGVCAAIGGGPAPVGAYLQTTATVTWSGVGCPAGGCTFSSSTLVGGPTTDSLRQASQLAIVTPAMPSDTRATIAFTPIQFVATNVIAPPLIFSGAIWVCSAGESTAKSLVTDGATTGLTLDSTTGVLSGAFKTSGDYCLRVTVTDAALNTAQTGPITWSVGKAAYQCTAPTTLYYGAPGGLSDPTYVGDATNKVRLRDLTACIPYSASNVYTVVKGDGATLNKPTNLRAVDGLHPVNPSLVCRPDIPAAKCAADDLSTSSMPYAPATYCFLINVTVSGGTVIPVYLVWPFVSSTGATPYPAPDGCTP